VNIQAYIFLLVFTLSTSAFAKDLLIIQKGKSFILKPGGPPVTTIDVNVGDVIKFKNEDEITHNVYSITSGNEFEIKVQKPGETGVVDINSKNHKKGKMEVECAIHPNMKLLVNIRK